MSKHYKIIAVGGGPAGIAAAIEGIEMGLKASDILVLEKGEVPIEAIRKFYPEKKMTVANYKGLPTVTEGHIPVFKDLTKAETLTYFDELIARYKIEMRFKTEVSKVRKNSDNAFVVLAGHEEILADVVMIGIGILGRPNKPEYKIPSSIKNNIFYDLTTSKIEAKKVLVVGGGDTSIEYADILQQEKNQVTLAYRGEEFHRAMSSNRETLKRLEESKALRVLRRCEIRELLDDQGKPKISFTQPEVFPDEIFDTLVYAIGGSTPINFLKTVGIECDLNTPKYGPSGETNIPGLYLIGDLACGRTGGSIITAYNSAFRSLRHFLSTSSKGEA